MRSDTDEPIGCEGDWLQGSNHKGFDQQSHLCGINFSIPQPQKARLNPNKCNCGKKNKDIGFNQVLIEFC